MVRIVQSVACCDPIDAQRATNGADAQRMAQPVAQQSESIPYETEGGNAQQPAQQARNERATNDVSRTGQMLRTGGAVAGAESRFSRAMARLAAFPEERVAVIAEAGEPAIVGVAFRGVVYGELEMPAARYDPLALLEMMRHHSGECARQSAPRIEASIGDTTGGDIGDRMRAMFSAPGEGQR